MDVSMNSFEVSVKDAVITVPPYFGVEERKGVLLSAEMVGVNVLALVNEHCGAALQYGIDKDFGNGSRYVVFYDMGASSTYVSAYSAKEYGKTVSANQFQDNTLHSWILDGNSILEVPLPPNILGTKISSDVPNVSDACFGIAVSPANLVVSVAVGLAQMRQWVANNDCKDYFKLLASEVQKIEKRCVAEEECSYCSAPVVFQDTEVAY